MSEYERGPFARTHPALNEPRKGRLARAAAPENKDALPRADFEALDVERQRVFEMHRGVFDGDDGRVNR